MAGGVPTAERPVCNSSGDRRNPDLHPGVLASAGSDDRVEEAWAMITASAAHPRGPGEVWTPRTVATTLIEHTLVGELLGRALDPACGAGSLLLALAARVWADAGTAPGCDRLAWLSVHVCGWEVDPSPTELSRGVLAVAAGVEATNLDDVVLVRDTLLSETVDAEASLVLCNPPWVGASELEVDRRRELRMRFESARGNWDLWCPFVQRAVELTEPDGVLGLLLPSVALSADYGRAVRAWVLAAGSVQRIEELPEHSFAGAVVQTVLAVVHRGSSPAPTRWRGADGVVRLVALPVGGDRWRREVAMLGTGRTVGDVFEVRGAATVAEAYALVPHLRDEAEPGPGLVRLVNTGTIDPDTSLWGRKPLRYLGGRYLHPVVPTDALCDRRRAQAASSKVILAGMVKRLEAIADPHGEWMAGKSTVVVLVDTPEQALALADWLHRDEVSQWYLETFRGLLFRGGYTRVGPRQVRAIPLPEGWP